MQSKLWSPRWRPRLMRYLALVLLAACESAEGVPPVGAQADASTFVDAGIEGLDAAMPTPDAQVPTPDARAPLCNGQKICDTFESYPAAALTSGMTLGPWKVSVDAANGAVSIDSGKAFSGTRSLKVHIGDAAAGGGQLRAKPMFAPAPGTQHLYGKFRMFLEAASGTSKHWTMFGASGTVPAGTPISGNHVTYLFSVSNDNGKNRFSDVFYNDQTMQDCWHHSTQLVPTGAWTCVSFEADGAAIKYRTGINGTPVASLSVDQTGDGCLNAPAKAPWYGPVFDEFYIGARSFHPMTAPLDMWIDDVVVDTNVVTCD